MKHRYSAEIQRTRGLLELAAALYDTSLSFQTTRAAEQVIQTESRVGYSLTLANGQLTRQDVAGTEPLNRILIPVVLGANGLFNIAGSNEMKVDDLSGFGKSLTKTGSGVLELGYATYTGNTDILAGTLKVWSAPS